MSDLMRGDQSAFVRALGFISDGPEDALDLGPDDRNDDPPHAPNGDPQEEPEEEHDDDEQEPDGRWVFSTEAGCWLYE